IKSAKNGAKFFRTSVVVFSSSTDPNWPESLIEKIERAWKQLEEARGIHCTFNDLDHHQIAALASCFIPGYKSSEQIQLISKLSKSLQQLQDSACRIAEIKHKYKLEVNVDEYVEEVVRPFLMDVIYCWSKVLCYTTGALCYWYVLGDTQELFLGRSKQVFEVDLVRGQLPRARERYGRPLNSDKEVRHVEETVNVNNQKVEIKVETFMKDVSEGDNQNEMGYQMESSVFIEEY
nr:DExH-box ATP-dependent RNA helicase DExH10 [Tanacetum cinerariifolium]